MWWLGQVASPLMGAAAEPVMERQLYRESEPAIGPAEIAIGGALVAGAAAGAWCYFEDCLSQGDEADAELSE